MIDSYYLASATQGPETTTLNGSVAVDVCIIGAGYTGLSSALHLSQRGYSVAVVEAETVGFGASGRNGGHVGVGQRKDQFYLERQFGESTARALWDLGLEAKETVAALISEHNIDCDLKQGIVHLAHKARYNADLKEETAHLRNHYGYNEIDYVEGDALAEVIGSNAYHSAQIDRGSLHLHPLNYSLGLARAAVAAGATIYEQSRVIDIQHSSPALVRTAGGEVKARHVVLACNGYIEKLEPKINGYIMPINNFLIATEPLSTAQAKAIIPLDTAMQDTRFVINYWKLSGDNRLVFGGGENYRRGFPKDIKSFVRRYMLEIYPQLEDARIDYGWGGTLAITMNRLPHFGRIGENIWHLQGYSGHGVPTATFAGKLIAEAIDGSPERFNTVANLPTPKFPGGTLLRWPGMVAGMLYYAMRDRI